MEFIHQDRERCLAVERGSQEAAERLLEDHYQAVFAYHRRQVACDADAADLTQETFARVWQNLGTFRAASSVRTWIHRIAYCTWIDWVRRQRKPETQSEGWWDNLPCPVANPSIAAMDAESQRNLWMQVAALPDDERHVIHLHFGQQLTQAQAAEVLQVSLSTFKVRLNSAMDRLRRRLQSEAPAPTLSHS
jgi:RNA polymerase sigma-70 factor (ECF subfamily)